MPFFLPMMEVQSSLTLMGQDLVGKQYGYGSYFNTAVLQ